MTKIIDCKNYCFRKYNIIYYGVIRSGAYPKKTKKKYKVIECQKCGLIKLNPFPKISYITKEYRNRYNLKLSINNYKKFNNTKQKVEFFKINRNSIKNKTILDHGAGYGLLLDDIKKISKKTLAIEPQKNLHSFLENKKHEIVNHLSPNPQLFNKVDVVTSVGVVEHVRNPLDYLRLSFKLLKKGGKLHICTDNFFDILMDLDIKEFKSFYFRTAHYWYFHSKNLRNLLLKAGFKKLKLKYIHNHGFNNFLHWAENKKPLNDNNIKINKVNKKWIYTLEKIGKSELLIFECEK